jgi:hypothetical protein
MDDSTATMIDTSKPDSGLKLHFESNEKCNATHNYAFTIEIKCLDDVTNSVPRIVSQSVANNTCSPKVYLENDAGKSIHNY